MTQKKSNVNFNSYNLGLISGKFEQDKDGKSIFVPNITNKNPSLNSLMVDYKGTEKSREQVLEEELLVNPKVSIDKECFKKSSWERSILKKMKSEHFNELKKAGFDPKKRMNLSEPTVTVV